MILAWTGPKLSRGQASDWHTQTQTHTQEKTIPEGQNWPLVKMNSEMLIMSITHLNVLPVSSLFQLSLDFRLFLLLLFLGQVLLLLLAGFLLVDHHRLPRQDLGVTLTEPLPCTETYPRPSALLSSSLLRPRQWSGHQCLVVSDVTTPALKPWAWLVPNFSFQSIPLKKWHNNDYCSVLSSAK